MISMKHLLYMIALLATSALTSCMNNDNGEREGILILKPVSSSNFSSTEFEDVNQLRYIPTQAIMTPPESELAWVHFKYNQHDLYNNNKSINIDLLNQPIYIRQEYMEQNLPEYMEGNEHSLYACSGQMWGMDYLLLDITMFVNKDTPNDELLEEVKHQHNLTLYYDVTEESRYNVLELQLRYQINGGEVSEDNLRKYTKEFNDIRYFKIKDVLEEYKQVNGELPSTIKIKYYKSRQAQANIVTDTWRPETIDVQLEGGY